MGNSFFQFKQFTIVQEKCAMKVGTDGVLLGAWADVVSAKRILDVGTGTGLVALMLAQRSSATIIGLEIDELAVEEAKENVLNSPWKDRVEIIRQDFKEYKPGVTFDLIVSNPPYFVDSLNSPNRSRNLARHTDSLSFIDLFEGVVNLLTADGLFSIVIPYNAVENAVDCAAEQKLHLFQQLNIATTPGKPYKRVLLSFSFKKRDLEINEILLEKERHVYSDEFTNLVKEFYLKM